MRARALTHTHTQTHTHTHTHTFILNTWNYKNCTTLHNSSGHIVSCFEMREKLIIIPVHKYSVSWMDNHNTRLK